MCSESVSHFVAIGLIKTIKIPMVHEITLALSKYGALGSISIQKKNLNWPSNSFYFSMYCKTNSVSDLTVFLGVLKLSVFCDQKLSRFLGSQFLSMGRLH